MDSRTGSIRVVGAPGADRGATRQVPRGVLVAVTAGILALLLAATGGETQAPNAVAPPSPVSTSPETRVPPSLDAWGVVRYYEAPDDGAMVVATTAQDVSELADRPTTGRRVAVGFGVTVLAWRERSFSFVVAARGVTLTDMLDVAAGIEMVPTGVSSAPLPTPRDLPPDFVLMRSASARLAGAPGAGTR